MLDNHIYNLINQLTQENKSLWRIRDIYKKDSSDCPVCQAFWAKMEADKESFVNELAEMVKSHMK